MKIGSVIIISIVSIAALLALTSAAKTQSYPAYGPYPYANGYAVYPYVPSVVIVPGHAPSYVPGTEEGLSPRCDSYCQQVESDAEILGR